MSFAKQCILLFSTKYRNVHSFPIHNSTIIANLLKSVTITSGKQFSTLRNIQEQQNHLKKLNFEFEHVDDVSSVTDIYKNEKDIRNFMALFPSFVDDVLKIKRYFPHAIMEDRMKKLLNYTVPDGKKLRAMTFFAWRRSLEKSPLLNKDELLLMYIMGWCLELYQAFLIVMDDMLDKSNERRGRSSWHIYQTKEGYPQHLAMNDCSLLNDLIYLVLQNYFSDKDYYLPVAELFHYISVRSINAQTMDVVVSCMNRKTDKFRTFSLDKYQQIAMNKTSYQAFICPFETAALMSGTYDADLIQKARDVLLRIGIYYQVQNDYDCFGDSNVTGRIGDDIESGKCTWLILTALKQASSEQKEQLEKYYATNNEDALKVKEIYTELGIPSLYAKYENETYKSIVDQIYNLPAILPIKMFKSIFESVRKIYDK